ncbi:RNA methyltransferase superfamily [Treponema primitia ZAS-2]|uniref:Ribosomal RNA small subunit methyltransferase E n=1 Tax=Treponema primitia (strain ATCC BAA-887 / DSM 12427 / ZAS-2) TaxID=545694 RepID=F5YLH7_TREPZ|nr:RsmE family RNA methyltransferase [Treponema primitia]AEF86863.1 RNA methyltransferase superfamily [Treponema primitia ZAS-2]
MNIILFEPPELGKPLPKRDERTIHLLKVLHKKPGDTFDAGILRDKPGIPGEASRGAGKIEAIEPDGALAYSLDLDEIPPPRLPIRIAVGFPRPIQIRRILRDLSNLGLEAVDFIGTELGEKSYRDTKLFTDGGARAALIEGAVQARDTTIPELSLYPSLIEWLEKRPWDKAPDAGNSPAKADVARGAGQESATCNEVSRATCNEVPRALLIAPDNVRPSGAMASLPPHGGPIVLAIGPERGWSDRERDLLDKAGFARLSLGNRALRTETACITAAVLAMEKIGALW